MVRDFRVIVKCFLVITKTLETHMGQGFQGFTLYGGAGVTKNFVKTLDNFRRVRLTLICEQTAQ